VYPRDRQPTPKLATFIDFMLERFGPATPLLPMLHGGLRAAR
jgi:hypothetical protein